MHLLHFRVIDELWLTFRFLFHEFICWIKIEEQWYIGDIFLHVLRRITVRILYSSSKCWVNVYIIVVFSPKNTIIAVMPPFRTVWWSRLIWLVAATSALAFGQYLWALVIWTMLLTKAHNLPLICGLVLQGRLLSSLDIHPLGVYFALAAAFFYTVSLR